MLHERHYLNTQQAKTHFACPQLFFAQYQAFCWCSENARYDWPAMIIGRRRARANASTASWDIVSVRMALPIDMKNLNKNS